MKATRWLLALALTVPAAVHAQDSSAIRNLMGTTPDSTAGHGPSAPLALHSSVHLTFVGDINLGTLTIRAAIPADSGRQFFSRVDTLLKGDLVIGNFEGVLADTGASEKCGKGIRIDSIAALPPLPEPAPKAKSRPATKPRPRHGKPKPRMCYAFATPTWMAPRLAEARFTHLNLANNHSNDMGAGARQASDSILRSLELQTYGPLGSISIDTIVRGDSATVVGLIGFTTYPFAYDLLDIERSKVVIDSIRPLVDLLVVTFHGGAEGEKAQHVPPGPEQLGKEERGDLRTWAHAVIDAGADLIVGHGPHVLRGIEFYHGHPIAYSLGNFATYRGFNLAGPAGLSTILQVVFNPDATLLTARVVPLMQVAALGPRPDPARRAAALIRRLSRVDFGAAAARIDANGNISPP